MLKPVDKRVVTNFEYLMQYLTSPEQVTRNNEVGVMNASIALLDAIIQGKLVLCADEPEQPPADPDKIEEIPES